MLAVKRSTEIRARIDAWLLAAVFLFAFCFLGLFTSKFAPMFQDMEFVLPATVRLIVVCGPVAFPLLGILAAVSFVLSNVYFRRQWPQLALMLLYGLVILWVFQSLLTPRFNTETSRSANTEIGCKTNSASAFESDGVIRDRFTNSPTPLPPLRTFACGSS